VKASHVTYIDGVLSSFMSFKKTGICDCFTTFATTLVFIYFMSSFSCMKGARTKEGFPHCSRPLGSSCVSVLMRMKDRGWRGACLSCITFVEFLCRVSSHLLIHFKSRKIFKPCKPGNHEKREQMQQKYMIGMRKIRTEINKKQ
jgi:hypothetical protein